MHHVCRMQMDAAVTAATRAALKRPNETVAAEWNALKTLALAETPAVRFKAEMGKWVVECGVVGLTSDLILIISGYRHYTDQTYESVSKRLDSAIEMEHTLQTEVNCAWLAKDRAATRREQTKATVDLYAVGIGPEPLERSVVRYLTFLTSECDDAKLTHDVAEERYVQWESDSQRVKLHRLRLQHLLRLAIFAHLPPIAFAMLTEFYSEDNPDEADACDFLVEFRGYGSDGMGVDTSVGMVVQFEFENIVFTTGSVPFNDDNCASTHAWVYGPPTLVGLSTSINARATQYTGLEYRAAVDACADTYFQTHLANGKAVFAKSYYCIHPESMIRDLLANGHSFPAAVIYLCILNLGSENTKDTPSRMYAQYEGDIETDATWRGQRLFYKLYLDQCNAITAATDASSSPPSKRIKRSVYE